MERRDPLMLEVLEQLKSIREENYRFAQETSFSFQSVHARLDAIEQDRDRGTPLRHSTQACGLESDESSASGYWVNGDGSFSSRDTDRPGRRVVPEYLTNGLNQEQANHILSSLCDDDDTFYGPGPIAEGNERKGLILAGKKTDKGISRFQLAGPPSRSKSTKSKKSYFQQLMGAEETTEKDPAIKAGLVDENGEEVDRNVYTSKMANYVQRNPCSQFVHDIVSTPIHPNSTLRTRWDLMILILLVYVCITAPVVVCFEISLDEGGGMWWWENIVNIIFVIDIFLNINTAYYDTEDNLVTNRKQIFSQYLTTWMVVDVIAVLPYEYMTPGSTTNADEAATLAKGLKLTKFTRILRVLRVIKLLRVLKVPALLKRFEGAAGYGIVKFLSILGGAILMNHLVACFFYYTAHLRMGDDLDNHLKILGIPYGQFMKVMANNSEAPGYVYDPVLLASYEEIQKNAWNMTWVYNAGLEDQTHVERYITALYWGMSTLTTVGYGDVTPMNSAEKIMSMVAMVVGVTVFAYFMGTTAALITNMNSNDSARTRKIGEMDNFLRARHVPSAMAEKIRKFYSKAVQHQMVDNEDMVTQLSMPLRTELLLFLYRNTLEKVPFFKGKDPQFITALVAKLRMEYYAEGDIVIHEGDLGNVMYFVVKGTLEARQYIFEPNSKHSDDIEVPLVHDEETGKPIETLKAIRQKILRRTVSKSEAEIRAFLQKKPEEFGFYSNVRELKRKFRLVGELHDGEHFGEYSCLLGQHRTSTIVSLDFSELYSLSRDDLMEVYKLWPELHKEFLQLMKQFQELTGTELTDEEFEQQYGALPSLRSGDWPAEELGAAIVPGSVNRERRDTLPTLDEREPSVHGPEISAHSGSFNNGSYHASASPEGRIRKGSTSDGEGSTVSDRQRDQVSMKKAVQLMMNMKKFDKLAANPVFQLLSEGQDLKGVRMKAGGDASSSNSEHASQSDLAAPAAAPPGDV